MAEKAITQPWVDKPLVTRPWAKFLPNWLLWPISMTVVVSMIWGYFATQHPVRLVVDGQAVTVGTHQTSVEGLLSELGLTLDEADIVVAGGDNEEVIIQRAHPVIITVDGDTHSLSTHSTTIGQALEEAGIEVGDKDRILVDDQPATLETPLSPSVSPPLAPLEASQVEIFRSHTLQVFDNGAPLVLETVAPTVGQALWESGTPVFIGDRVQPPLETSVSSGLRVYIDRGTPMVIWADGRRIPAIAQGNTVQDALASESIYLHGKDYTIPAADSLLASNLEVQVIRVQEKLVVEEEPIPFQTLWQPDPEMELDQWRVITPGEQGLMRRQVREVYENGNLKERITEGEWTVTSPTIQVMAYGTNIVIRELETPEGVITYWRKIRMLATSYTAATSGKPRGHPTYGITRLGWVATKGVVAVDPYVINLGSKVYVPVYGPATAADTGGAILGRRIDLAYDEDNLVLWYKWVDVYLLEPAPPLDEIIWVLPNYPSERK